MRFSATTLDLLKLELERAFDDLTNPQEPKPVYACTTANMPPAADFKDCILRNTTLDVLAYSNGTNWLRADTGAII